MKKIFVTMMLCAMTLAASAQVKSIDIKGNLRSDFGVGVGITADLIDKFEIAPSFNYYFNDANYLHIDADFHYNFEVGNNFKLYPLAGVAYHHAKGDFNKFGFNLGAGAGYQFTQKIEGFLEGKYSWVEHGDDSFFSLGIKIAI